MNDPQWWTVVPISAIVSAIVTIAIRYLDKPRPHLTLVGHMISTPSGYKGDGKEFGYPLTLTNAGNGPAWRVSIAGSSCTAGIRHDRAPAAAPSSNWVDFIPVIKAGESVSIQAANADDLSKAALVVVHDRFPSLPRLSWVKRARTWRLEKLPVSNPFPPAMYPGETIPWWRRRFGVIRRYGVQWRSNHMDDG